MSEGASRQAAAVMGLCGGLGLVVWGALRVVLGSWRAAGILAIAPPWDGPIVLFSALAFSILPLSHLASVPSFSSRFTFVPFPHASLPFVSLLTDFGPHDLVPSPAEK